MYLNFTEKFKSKQIFTKVKQKYSRDGNTDFNNSSKHCHTIKN